MKITDGSKIFIKNDALNKYLFVLRDNKPNIPNPNMWGLFGGGIEPGESPDETIRREIAEEVDIDVFDIKKIYCQKIVHNVQGQQREITGHYFVGKTNVDDLPEIELREGQKMSFFHLKK
ncbi:MAG: NUDIX domain-containing protein [Candidatus Buchananbacteria bacterium]|nr:NUDIX domain-containing protein [Candidatus Buchananbacteria bacterium]